MVRVDRIPNAGRILRTRATQLDGLRGVAVLSVVVSHCFPETFLGKIDLLSELGMNAVYLFFVLSAYLITTQLLATRDALRDPAAARAGGGAMRGWRAIGIFYAKRALRLFPAYYIAICGAAIVNISGMRAELPWHALHASNLLFALHPDIGETSAAGHLWSLSVEEQFYLVWPLLILFVPRRWMGPALLLCFAIGVYAWSPFNALPEALDAVGIASSLDSLAIGAMLAVAQARGRRLDRLTVLVAPVAAVVALAFLLQFRSLGTASDVAMLVGHEALNLLFAFLIWRAAGGMGGAAGRFLEGAALRYLGRISYGMYVYHLFVMAFVQKLALHFGREFDEGWPMFVVVLAGSIGAAAVSWHVVEAPVNRFRHRLGRTAGAPAATPSPAS